MRADFAPLESFIRLRCVLERDRETVEQSRGKC